MTTTNMSLNEPSVGTTAGPTWATEVNENFTTIDQHDHTSGKGVQLTPSALNINSDLEFNGNAAIELKRLTFDSSATGSGTNYSVYQSGGNLYWYNGSGQAVQITNGANVKTTGGSIDGMSGTDAAVDYGSGIYRFEFDSTKTPFAGAKMSHADINLYKYDGSSGSNAYVILKYTGSSEGSNNLTFPDETGTLLSTATSFGGAINIDATGGSGSITLDAATSLNVNTGSSSGNDLKVNTSQLVVEGDTGNIGIGRNDPAYALDIKSGDIRIEDSSANKPALFFTNTDDTRGCSVSGSLNTLVLNAGDTDVATGGTSALSFQTDSTERMRVDSSGNVHIADNTNGPDAALHIEKTTPQIRLQINGNSGYNTIESGTGSGSNELIFGRSGSEKMRIDGSGRVLIGADSVDSGVQFSPLLYVRRSGTTSTSVVTFADYDTSPAGNITLELSTPRDTGWTTKYEIAFTNSGVMYGSISSTGSAISFNTASDYRLKENVTPLTGAIDRLNQLKPLRFNFIKDPDTTLDGFLAHEVSDIVPEAVTGEKDAVNEDGKIQPQGLDLAKIVPLLVGAVQELSKKIT